MQHVILWLTLTEVSESLESAQEFCWTAAFLTKVGFWKTLQKSCLLIFFTFHLGLKVISCIKVHKYTSQHFSPYFFSHVSILCNLIDVLFRRGNSSKSLVKEQNITWPPSLAVTQQSFPPKSVVCSSSFPFVYYLQPVVHPHDNIHIQDNLN